MRFPGFTLLVCALALPAAGQFKNTLQLNGDVIATEGIQLYIDFDPFTAAAPTLPPPASPADADLHVIIPATGGASFGMTSNAMSNSVANAINEAFLDSEFFGGSFKAEPRASLSGVLESHDATVVIVSPVDIHEIYASMGAGAAPSMAVPPPPGVSYNPTISNRTEQILAAHPGGPNAQHTVNGIDPATNDFHTIEHTLPGFLSLEFNSGANTNAGVLLMASPEYNPGLFDLTAIGMPGSIDIGTGVNAMGLPMGLTFVFDGINNTVNPVTDPFHRTDSAGNLVTGLNIGASFAGAAFATQALIVDQTAPFGVSITQAAHINMAVGQRRVLTPSSDGSAPFTLTPPHVFEFYGVAYSTLHVNENGFVTFGAPSSLTTGNIDPVSALMAEPGIFVNMADYDGTTSGIVVEEFGPEVRIRYGAQAPFTHIGGTDQAVFGITLHTTVPAGTTPPSLIEATDDLVSIEQNAGSIFFDYDLLDDTLATDPVRTFDAFIGISPGGIAAATMIPSLDLGEFQVPMIPMAPIVSLENADNMAQSMLLANGAPQQYHNGQALRDLSVSFYPVTFTGAPSYYSVPTNRKPDDLRGADVVSLSRSQNIAQPLNFNLVGKFRYLFQSSATPLSPLAALTPSGGGQVVPLLIQAVMDPNGESGAPMTIPNAPGFRDFEGARVELPPGSLTSLAVGTSLDIVVTFASGVTRTAPGVLTVIP